MSGSRQGLLNFRRDDDRDIFLDVKLLASYPNFRPKDKKIMGNYWYELKINVELSNVKRTSVDRLSKRIIRALNEQFQFDLDDLKARLEKEGVKDCQLYSFNVAVSYNINLDYHQTLISHPELMQSYHERKRNIYDMGAHESKALPDKDIGLSVYPLHELEVFCLHHMDSPECFSEKCDSALEMCKATFVAVGNKVISEMEELLPKKNFSCSLL